MKIQRLLAFHRQSDSLFSVGCWRSFAYPRYLSVNASSIDLEPSTQPTLGKWATVRDLFEARVHLGHREGSLDPRMKPYIWGSRLGHLIIDLDITVRHLRRALEVIREIALRDGIILFVSSSPSCVLSVEKVAKEVGEFAHTRHWRLGTLTNSTMMFGAVTRLPDLIVSIGQHPALVEAAKMTIPTVAVLDTDCNPSIITYPIPGNDDTPCAIQLYLNLFSQAIMAGKNEAVMIKNAEKKTN